MAPKGPDDEPDVIKVDFTKRERVAQDERIAQKTRNYRSEFMAVQRAGALLKEFMELIEDDYRTRGDRPAIGAAHTSLMNFIHRFTNQSGGYRQAATYRATMADARYHALSVNELAQILEDAGDRWKSKPQFYEAIAKILDGKLRANAGGNVQAMSLVELVALMDVPKEQWQANLNGFFTLAFFLRAKMHESEKRGQ